MIQCKHNVKVVQRWARSFSLLPVFVGLLEIKFIFFHIVYLMMRLQTVLTVIPCTHVTRHQHMPCAYCSLSFSCKVNVIKKSFPSDPSFDFIQIAICCLLSFYVNVLLLSLYSPCNPQLVSLSLAVY